MPVVAIAGSRDRADLAAFRCARPGAWFEERVERFVRSHFLDGPPMSEFRSYEALTLRSEGELVAVASLREWAEAPPAGGTEFVVAAVSLPRRGARIEGDGSLAYFVMRTLIHAAREADRGPLICGIVAKENERSLRMCRLAGLTHEMQYDTHHVRLVGRL